GRFVLVDADPGVEGVDVVALGVALGSGEPEVALRGGEVLVPRLVEVPARPEQGSGSGVGDGVGGGVVLVTGGTGGLGGLVARHLVEGGVRRLVLTSRRGLEAPGAGALLDDLVGLGAEVVVEACDVSDRG
ncbi:KR domain-containing protein, partial [Streptomyces sp. JV185]|uniref:KR domain-containing protein n=1 Tax=Streptomyces sp. JV185 TaxID=858638 RepID=UPI002E770E86